MFGNSAPSVADIAAVTDNNRNSGWGGDGGWWVLIILFALFGWGGNRGFGGYGNGGGTFDGGIPNGFALATDDGRRRPRAQAPAQARPRRAHVGDVT